MTRDAGRGAGAGSAGRPLRVNRQRAVATTTLIYSETRTGTPVVDMWLNAANSELNHGGRSRGASRRRLVVDEGRGAVLLAPVACVAWTSVS
ncbi:hypothetical protein ACFZCL_39150 [Streptomyces sp. NPDC008159]|uniref:hypothetical protein n=1 Tax=Streptomyces sp. NPDC008159 TaxID=3364817 RepID=UPI0036E5EABD